MSQVDLKSKKKAYVENLQAQSLQSKTL